MSSVAIRNTVGSAVAIGSVLGSLSASPVVSNLVGYVAQQGAQAVGRYVSSSAQSVGRYVADRGKRYLESAPRLGFKRHRPEVSSRALVPYRPGPKRQFVVVKPQSNYTRRPARRVRRRRHTYRR